ncbi:hypothetical protein ACHAWF_013294 [Thalassiosira exigua]
MDLFRSRVAQSAKAAAGAARQLSSLDDMAQNDDYVHSEGLRISDTKEPPSSASSYAGSSELPSVVEDLSGRFVDALSTAARKHNVPARVANEQDSLDSRNVVRQPLHRDLETEQKRESMATAKRHPTTHRPKLTAQAPKLVPAVAALYNENGKIKSDTNRPGAEGGRKQPHAHNKTHHQNRPKDKGGKSALKADLSHASIPSPGHQTNVLLVDERHAHILHELDYDSDTDSSDDDEPRIRSDLELGVLGNSALPDQLEHELEESIERQNSLNAPTNGNNQKDVHRFMKMTADLESEREVLLKSLESGPQPTPTNENANVPWSQDVRMSTAGEETNKALRAGLSWVRNVASPQLEALSKQIMTKVSEADKTRKHLSEQTLPGRGPMIGPRHPPRAEAATDHEKITLTSSATFLADDDMAELERIRMRSSSSKMGSLIQACLDNPRLSFIGLTLALALFVYFYSRHRSVDDVL